MSAAAQMPAVVRLFIEGVIGRMRLHREPPAKKTVNGGKTYVGWSMHFYEVHRGLLKEYREQPIEAEFPPSHRYAREVRPQEVENILVVADRIAALEEQLRVARLDLQILLEHAALRGRKVRVSGGGE